jgi:hypothetical protein
MTWTCFSTGHTLVSSLVGSADTVPCVCRCIVPLASLTPLFVSTFWTQLHHGTKCTVETTLISRQCCTYCSAEVLFPYLISCRSASLTPSEIKSLTVIENPNCSTCISFTMNGSRTGTPYLRSPETQSLFEIHSSLCLNQQIANRYLVFTQRCFWWLESSGMRVGIARLVNAEVSHKTIAFILQSWRIQRP